jgi:hypothetical protein
LGAPISSGAPGNCPFYPMVNPALLSSLVLLSTALISAYELRLCVIDLKLITSKIIFSIKLIIKTIEVVFTYLQSEFPIFKIELCVY